MNPGLIRILTILYEYVEVTDRSYTGGSVTGVEKHVVEVGPAMKANQGVRKADREGDRLLEELMGYSISEKVKEVVVESIKDKIIEGIIDQFFRRYHGKKERDR